MVVAQQIFADQYLVVSGLAKHAYGLLMAMYPGCGPGRGDGKRETVELTKPLCGHQRRSFRFWVRVDKKEPKLARGDNAEVAAVWCLHAQLQHIVHSQERGPALEGAGHGRRRVLRWRRTSADQREDRDKRGDRSSGRRFSCRQSCASVHAVGAGPRNWRRLSITYKRYTPAAASRCFSEWPLSSCPVSAKICASKSSPSLASA